jgi:hypothetical protein
MLLNEHFGNYAAAGGTAFGPLHRSLAVESIEFQLTTLSPPPLLFSEDKL